MSIQDDPLKDAKLDDPSEQFKTFVHNAAFMEKVFRGLGKDISELNTMTVNEFLQICAEKQVWLEQGESAPDKKRCEHEQRLKMQEFEAEIQRRRQMLEGMKWSGPTYNEPSILEKLKDKWGR